MQCRTTDLPFPLPFCRPYLCSKGADSSYNNRTYTKIGELGVFSSEELSQDEINGIQTFVQPLFDDPLMTSVRRLPSRFADESSAKEYPRQTWH